MLGLFRRKPRALVPGRTDDESKWFWDHYDDAPAQIEDFCVPSGVQLAERDIADIGCGDGLMALGLNARVKPRSIVGIDINTVDVGVLLERARRYGVADELPESLSFLRSEPNRLPVEDDSFDVVYTWSAFEHVREPVALLTEIARVMRPGGTLMLQLWPFFFSERGSHLWDWFPDPHHHLVDLPETIAAAARESGVHPHEWTEYMLNEFSLLNRITLDDLHRALLAAGMEVRKVELMAGATHVPSAANRYPLSHLATGGVKLLAVHSAH
jgi:ubiquinone/menaquinone biosynthesis C-methylase UbiE